MQHSSLTEMGILIVEDDPLLRRQIAATLEKLGADVTSAVDLCAARQFAKDLDFDFALLDLNLPDGLGMDLLRERVFLGSVGLVIMTANSNVPSAVEAMKLGALDYLVKPFIPMELPLVLERARRAPCPGRTAAASSLSHLQTNNRHWKILIVASQIDRCCGRNRRFCL